MRQGSILLIPFPYAELTNLKVRPAVVIAYTKDKYKDIIVCAISSVLPLSISENEILIESTVENGLKVNSVIKVDRIVTLKQSEVLKELGNLSDSLCKQLKVKFINLV